MWNKAFPWMQRTARRLQAKRPRVEIRRGVREELLILIDGQIASLTHPGTVPSLKAAGTPVVRALCQVLETGTPEARSGAAWLLGQIGSEAAIPALARLVEGAGWRGETPVVLRRASEALVRLGSGGIEAFARAIGALAQDDLGRLLLIRHAAQQILRTSPLPPLPSRITSAWCRALTGYLRRLERLDRLSRADKLSLERIVLEAYGVPLEGERDTVPRLVEALSRYPSQARDRAGGSG